jgi:hypothetical protein
MWMVNRRQGGKLVTRSLPINNSGEYVPTELCRQNGSSSEGTGLNCNMMSSRLKTNRKSYDILHTIPVVTQGVSASNAPLWSFWQCLTSTQSDQNSAFGGHVDTGDQSVGGRLFVAWQSSSGSR